ncbi:MAG TPA: hypothetical protein VMM84_00795 [Pyrinomonadaceae bacterium]|nr:hypothetical protein [Pyrinomonadaceae bacterium]
MSIKPVPNTGQPVETTVLRMIVPLSEKWHFEKRDFFVPRATPSDAPPTMSLDRSGGSVKRRMKGHYQGNSTERLDLSGSARNVELRFATSEKTFVILQVFHRPVGRRADAPGSWIWPP